LSSATRNMPSMREMISNSRLVPLEYSFSPLMWKASLVLPGWSMLDSSSGISSDCVGEGVIARLF
jgi:hypothetical protein